MKTLKIIAVAVLLLAAAAAGAVEPGMGTSAGHDLDALWARAQQTVDLDSQDAVILLDSRTTTVGDEGTVAVRVHQVVWIATSRGIRGYADLRVPWDSATSTLEVEKLRTWRDGRWWPDPEQISDTAVVETLPYAVGHADDYTTLRETMLLHDGVELPCIMETAYTIAVQGPPDAGADDVFVFPRRDPVVRSEYVVRVPVGTDVKWEALNGAPEPAVTENGVREFAWTVEGAGALKLPVTSQPEAYEPAVVWSTWESWEALLGRFAEAVDAAAVLDEALADSVAAVTAGVPEGGDRVKAVLGFVDRSVRPIHTDFLPYLLSPRPAARTFATGYGHDLDRAVLVSALLAAVRGGEPHAVVVPVRHGHGAVAPDLPRLSDFDGLRVHVDMYGAGFRLFFDPADDSLTGDYERFALVRGGGDRSQAGGHVKIDVSLQQEDGVWEGTGTIFLRDAAVDWEELAIGDGTLAAFVQAALGSVVADAEVDWARINHVLAANMGARFGFHAPLADADDEGRFALRIGSPRRGVAYLLPSDVRLADEGRTSPVHLPAELSEEITVRVRTGDNVLRWTPEAREIGNAAGSFMVETVREEGWFTLTRKTEVAAADGIIAPAAWPDLRALLLEEQDPANGTIVLEEAK